MSCANGNAREHIELDWRQTPKPAICEEVCEELRITEVSKSRGRSLQIEGRCPFCFGEFTYLHTLKLVPAATVPTGQGDAVIDIVIECPCSHSHPRAPDNTTGCGQHWVIEVGRG